MKFVEDVLYCSENYVSITINYLWAVVQPVWSFWNVFSVGQKNKSLQSHAIKHNNIVRYKIVKIKLFDDCIIYNQIS